MIIAVALAHLPETAPGQVATGCTDDEYRAFDFWIGNWEVRGSDRALAGHNTIEVVAGGCALSETWRGSQGGQGKSLSYFSPLNRYWHQLWVDSTGLVLDLEGGLRRDGAMRMEGRGTDTTTLHRVEWTPLDDGRVRQHWQISADDGKTWSTLFDGYYRRVSSARGPRSDT